MAIRSFGSRNFNPDATDYTKRNNMPNNDATNYSVGKKVYGGGRSNPTSGPVDKMGYRERDAQTMARKNAMLRRLKSGQRNNFMSSGYQTPSDPTQRKM